MDDITRERIRALRRWFASGKDDSEAAARIVLIDRPDLVPGPFDEECREGYTGEESAILAALDAVLGEQR